MGTLWLRQRPTESAQQNHIEAQVFHLLTDGMPFTVATRLELPISGQVREEILGPVLLPDFLPSGLGQSAARPVGTGWAVAGATAARNLDDQPDRSPPWPVDKLVRPPATEPWPQQEIWRFKA